MQAHREEREAPVLYRLFHALTGCVEVRFVDLVADAVSPGCRRCDAGRSRTRKGIEDRVAGEGEEPY